MRTILLGMLFASTAFPAVLSFGVKGGVPLNDAFNAAMGVDTRYLTTTHRYTVGPELDVNLPLGLAVELDALYRRLDYGLTGPLANSSTRANAWDFPLLVKWRFAPGPIRPYVSAGPTFRSLSSIKQAVSFFSGTPLPYTSTARPEELQNRFTTGLTVGGGVQFDVHPVKVSPEIRYTRWGWDTFRSVNSLLRANPDQLDFMIGITF